MIAAVDRVAPRVGWRVGLPIACAGFAWLVWWLLATQQQLEEISTVSAVFGAGGTFETLKQPDEAIAAVARGRPGLFRAVNPSFISMDGSGDKSGHLWAFRITNWVGCPARAGQPYWLQAPMTSWLKGITTGVFYDDTVHSSIVLKKAGRFRHLEVPELAVVPRCVSGCEDPRLVADSTRKNVLYVLCNARSNPTCLSEMHVLVVSLSDIITAFNDSTAKSIPVLSIVKLRYEATRTHEKNWMLFQADNGRLLFVYSISPDHVIISCQLHDGVCTKLVESDNPFFAREVRGGSAAILFGDKYITVAHTRLSWNAYSTVVYSFNASFPFQVVSASPPFAFDRSYHLTVKPTCQFASGFGILGELAVLAYGDLDCDSSVFTVSIHQLVGALSLNLG